jgi:hypothetical protein
MKERNGEEWNGYSENRKIISPHTKQSYADSRKNKKSKITFSLTRHSRACYPPDQLLKRDPAAIIVAEYSFAAA